jgi:putative spermidine/putrescine transport system substrate-binding protein
MNIAQRPLARFVAGLTLSAFALGTLAPIAHAQTALKQIGKAEGQVDIVAWPGYIERGQTDKNFDWVTSRRRPAARST